MRFLYKTIGLGLNLWSLVAPRSAVRRVYTLFATPPKPVLRPKELAFLSTAQQVRGKAAGHEVVEYHWGPEAGPLVLLTYGWGYNAGRWRHFVPALTAAGFHVLAYDPPGHGLNQGARYLNLVTNSAIQSDLLERYGPATAILGHSFGGSAAVVTVKNQPGLQRPLRMVVMASFSNASRIFAEYRRLLGLWPALYHRMLHLIEHHAGMPVHAFDMARMSANLGNVEALIVHDPTEKVTPFSNALRYQAYWPGSALLQAHGAGHHLGKTEITNSIVQFLTEGILPAAAEISQQNLPADHDLVRFFAGMEA